MILLLSSLYCLCNIHIKIAYKISHYNHFQITNEFWEKIQNITKDFLDDEQFVTFPGYEWSGNTGLGGDRNVIFFKEGEAIRRSSHALVDGINDLHSDCNSSNDYSVNTIFK